MGDEGKEKGGNRVVQEFAISPGQLGAPDWVGFNGGMAQDNHRLCERC